MIKLRKKADITTAEPVAEVELSVDIARREFEFIAEKLRFYRAKAIDNPQLTKEFEDFKAAVCGILV